MPRVPLETKILPVKGFRECQIRERLNRFVVLVRLDGLEAKAHINNTGRLTELMIPGRTAYCLERPPHGKTRLRLFAVSEGHLGVLIDTRFQMTAFEKAVETGRIPWLAGFRMTRRNARLGTSLIDYELECGGRSTFCEVKSAAQRLGKQASYPDCPSLRGQRHIRELTALTRSGGRSLIVFMASLPGIDSFSPNKEADPEIHRLLKIAGNAGVEIKALGLHFDPGDGYIHLYNPDLEIEL